MKRIGYDMPVSIIGQAFAEKFSPEHLELIATAVTKMPSRVFAAAMLRPTFARLTRERQDEVLDWARALPETDELLISGKIDMLAACAVASLDQTRAGLQADVERLVAALPERKREEARSKLERDEAPFARRLRPAENLTYSRAALISELSKSEGSPHFGSSVFDALVEQDAEEILGACVDVLRASAAVERPALLNLIAELAPAIAKISGVEGIDGVVAVLRDNVERWG